MTAPAEQVLAAIDLLAPAFEASGLDELEVEVGELVVRLARPRAAATPPAAAATVSGLAAAPPGSVSPYGEPAPGMRFVTAPLTGVWYAAPSPGALRRCPLKARDSCLRIRTARRWGRRRNRAH